MKFNFEINDFYNGCGDSLSDETFVRNIMDAVVENIADRIWYNEVCGNYDESDVMDSLCHDTNVKIDNLLKAHQKEIIELAVDRVAEAIARKRQIIDMTPKAKELAQMNKENVEYFQEMIDKAIAKKFKG